MSYYKIDTYKDGALYLTEWFDASTGELQPPEFTPDPSAVVPFAASQPNWLGFNLFLKDSPVYRRMLTALPNSPTLRWMEASAISAATSSSATSRPLVPVIRGLWNDAVSQLSNGLTTEEVASLNAASSQFNMPFHFVSGGILTLRR